MIIFMTEALKLTHLAKGRGGVAVVGLRVGWRKLADVLQLYEVVVLFGCLAAA